MKLQIKILILLSVLTFQSHGTFAQTIYGTIYYKTTKSSRPDSGATIYLCRRTPRIDFDTDKLLMSEQVHKEYALSLSGTNRQAARHKKILLRQYHVTEKADVDKYLADASLEENKIISCPDVQIQIADDKGAYTFNNVPSGNYIVLIKSAHSTFSTFANIDVFPKQEIVISRILGE